MQKPRNPSGNALTIIQHSKLLSPQDRVLLQEGNEKLNNWRETISLDTSPDLHNILEILEPMLELFEVSSRKWTLPEYGRAVDIVLKGAYRKFQTWRCFAGWGQQSVVLRRNPILLLPIPQTDAAIRKCDCIGNISRFTRHGTLSLVEPMTLYKEMSGFPYQYTLCFINTSFKKIKYLLRETHLSCMGFNENYIEIENTLIKRYQGENAYEIERSRGKNLVSLQDTILLVSGLLDDVISYSRRVRGEIASSQSFIKNMLSKIKL